MKRTFAFMPVVLNVLYEERLGGPQLRVLQVARGLQAKGWETVVVIPRGDPAFALRLHAEGVPFQELRLVRLRRSWNPATHLAYLARFGPNVAELRRLIRRHGAEVVHTNGILHLQAAIAAHLEGAALVWHLNDSHSPFLLGWLCRPLVRRWSDRIAVTARAVGDYYFPNTRGVADRLHVVYPPVDISRFNPQVDGSGIREELGVPDDGPVIGTVANIVPGKGLEYLLEAAAGIRRRFPTARFVVAGRMLENRRAYWTALCRQRRQLNMDEHFVFVGYRPDIPRLLAALTLYIHPSESEAGPMAVLEASACGLPVVATDVGGPREILEDGQTGILVAARSPSQIEAAVVRLLQRPKLMRIMGMRGAERVRGLFSLEVCVQQHLRLYQAAIQHRAGRRGQLPMASQPDEKG